MSQDLAYEIECVTKARTTVLRGVMRLEHETARERLLLAITADLEATGSDPYTIDVSEVIFMNSSAFRMLAAVVQTAKRTRRRLLIVGNELVPWQRRTLGTLSPLYEGLEIRLKAPSKSPVLRRDHEVWALETAEGKTLRFKHSKGIAYLDQLFCRPGRELHVLEIIGAEGAGDAGPVLDGRAKAQYRERLEELRDELAEAESFNDTARAARARDEMEALAQQLSGAVGLGGRDRRSASDAERARVNVQRCVKEALDRIAEADPALGRYLSATVKTGTYCSFKPL